jgi:NADH dehydrogenase/NADH:ubiquinone oxidoreductase subunit G
MARTEDEHRMLFDLRGRRRNVIKVIYAVLAVLMGASLFLIGTGSGLGPLFGDGADNSELVERYEEQIERTERQLAKNPNDPNLLLSLTRTHLSAGDAMDDRDEATGAVILTPDSVQQYQEASDSWSKYLNATEEPSAGLATLIAPRLVSLAESQGSVANFKTNVRAAREAQEIVAEKRPNLNSLSTLAIYQLFNFDFEAAAETRAEAEKLTNSKSEKETLDRTLDEYEKAAREAEKQVKAAEKAAPSGSAAGQAALENPLGGLGGSSPGE